MLSMSLVTRLMRSPRRWLSKYASGSRVIFSSTSLAQSNIVRWMTPCEDEPLDVATVPRRPT